MAKVCAFNEFMVGMNELMSDPLEVRIEFVRYHSPLLGLDYSEEGDFAIIRSKWTQGIPIADTFAMILSRPIPVSPGHQAQLRAQWYSVNKKLYNVIRNNRMLLGTLCYFDGVPESDFF